MNGFEPKLRVGFDGSGGECYESHYESCYEIFDKGRKYDRNGKVVECSSSIRYQYCVKFLTRDGGSGELETGSITSSHLLSGQFLVSCYAYEGVSMAAMSSGSLTSCFCSKSATFSYSLRNCSTMIFSCSSTAIVMSDLAFSHSLRINNVRARS